MSQRAIQWVSSGDTGMSSMAIWSHMMGAEPLYPGHNYPSDPDDFGRCYRLLRLIPEWFPRIGEMAKYGPVWAGLAAEWSLLTVMYMDEIDTSGPRHSGSAPKLYARMKEIEKAGWAARSGEPSVSEVLGVPYQRAPHP